jgi:transaldolase
MTYPSEKASALDSLIRSGIVIASDTAEYNRIAVFNPTEATTNPSLVFAAVSKPEYADLIGKAVQYALSHRPSAPLDEKTELAMDRLLAQVGAQIARLIPGRVSVSVDPRLAYDIDAVIAKAKTLVSLLEELGVPRQRVLVKIPATYPGIIAARTLESGSSPIHTNLTLIFGSVQALACAQAGVSVISPFVGRVKDWWTAYEKKKTLPRTTCPFEVPRFWVYRKPQSEKYAGRSEHPGLSLVQEIREIYDARGFTGKTEIMAAGFRSVDEVVELAKKGRAGGADLLTLPPDLLTGLSIRIDADADGDGGGQTKADGGSQTKADGGSRRKLRRAWPPYMPTESSVAAVKLAYAADLADEMIAVDKLPEGLEKFAADVRALERVLRERVDAARPC